MPASLGTVPSASLVDANRSPSAISPSLDPAHSGGQAFNRGNGHGHTGIQRRRAPGTATHQRLSPGDLHHHRPGVFLRLHGPGDDDFPPRLDQNRVWPEFGPGRPAGQLQFLRHGAGRLAVGHACRPLWAQAGVPVEHRALGRGQLPVFHRPERGQPDPVPGAAGDRHGHGVSHRPVDALGDDSGPASRALHRPDGRLLAPGFRRRRGALVFPPAADRLA